MRTSTIVKSLGLLALLGSSASMAASTTITASNLAPGIGDLFTMTITSDAPNTFAATMGLAFNADTVAYVSGAPLAPWNVFVKNSPVTANPTVIDIEAPTGAIGANPGVYNAAILTFQAIAAGAANIVIDDDGGFISGWFDADTAEYIPNSYTQANVVVQGAVVPAPATLGLLATGLIGLALRARRKLAA
jgi:hypothetical protein